MTESLHIASLIVHTQPHAFESVTAWLESQGALEIHARSPAGKLVVVIESNHEKDLLALTERIQGQAGVLGAALIYHEQVEAPDETIELTPEPTKSRRPGPVATQKIPVKGATP